jgi:hypothetical protein
MSNAYPGAERRRSPRLAISLGASLRERGRSAFSVRLVDLSALGCRIQLYSDLDSDAMVWLKLPGLEPRVGRIAWCRGGFAGIELEAPLHEAVVDALLGADSRPSLDDLEELRRISERCRVLAARADGAEDEELSTELLKLARDCDVRTGAEPQPRPVP